jgi:hypothetical protein
VASLRKQGWRDWHILMAVLNATANLRVNAQINAGGDPEEVFEKVRKKLGSDGDESENEPAPPARLFTVDRLQGALRTTYVSTLQQHGFSVNQQAPDFRAIERFLRHRYHYWEIDVDHDDPFAEDD